MNKEQRRAVVECLMCASDVESPPLFDLGLGGDFDSDVAMTAIELKPVDGSPYGMSALEAAYRLIEADPELRAEWFAKPDLGALIAELPVIPNGDPEWQDKVLEKIDAGDFDLQACSSLDAIDQSEPTPAPEAALHDVHSDDEVTHVAKPIDERFDNGGEL